MARSDAVSRMQQPAACSSQPRGSSSQPRCGHSLEIHQRRCRQHRTDSSTPLTRAHTQGEIDISHDEMAQNLQGWLGEPGDAAAGWAWTTFAVKARVGVARRCCCIRTPPLPLVGVSIGMKMGCRQDDSRADGYGGLDRIGPGSVAVGDQSRQQLKLLAGLQLDREGQPVAAAAGGPEVSGERRAEGPPTMSTSTHRRALGWCHGHVDGGPWPSTRILSFSSRQSPSDEEGPRAKPTCGSTLSYCWIRLVDGCTN